MFGSKGRLISGEQNAACLGSPLQIPYLCINGDLEMKRDNSIGGWRLFKLAQEEFTGCLALEEGETQARTHTHGPLVSPSGCRRTFLLNVV